MKGRCDGFRFETPVDQHGLVVDGFVLFWGTKGQMAKIRQEFDDGARGPKPASLEAIRLSIEVVCV